VAAAGCYPTAAILALKPLVDAGLIDPGSIIVDAASGVSGAGQGAEGRRRTSTRWTRASAPTACSTTATRPRWSMALGGDRAVHAAPRADEPRHPRHLLRHGDGPCEPLEALRAAYAGRAVRARVGATPPATKWTLGSNAVHLTARYDPRTGRVLAIAALDNLVKGPPDR
jgi:N-acetyl-gamma-glutamyl-phosphate reductase